MKKIRDVLNNLKIITSSNKDVKDPSIDDLKESVSQTKTSLNLLIEAMEDGELVFKTKTSFLLYAEDLESLGFIMTGHSQNGQDHTWTFKLK